MNGEPATAPEIHFCRPVPFTTGCAQYRSWSHCRFKSHMETKVAMSRKWKALIIWIALPYVFDVFVMPTIENTFGRNTSTADWWQGTFNGRAMIAAVLWCVIPGAVGTALLWLAPITRFWVGTLVGALIAAGSLAVVARVILAVYGGFEENIEVRLEVFNLLLPSCCAGAYAGFLRFKDQTFSRSPALGSHAGPGLEPAHFGARYFISITILVLVMVGIWVAAMGRLRSWW